MTATKTLAMTIAAPGGPEALQLAEIALARAGAGRSAHPPELRRGELRRCLLPQRPLSAARLSGGARRRRGRRGRGARRGRRRSRGRRSGRLCRPSARRLRGRARPAGRRGWCGCRSDRPAHGVGAMARGLTAHLLLQQGRDPRARRLAACPCGGGRRRPTRHALGAPSRPPGRRHGRLARQGRNRPRRRRRSGLAARAIPSGSRRRAASPTARASNWRSTGSAARRSRVRSTRCARSESSRRSASRPGRSRRSPSRRSAFPRAIAVARPSVLAYANDPDLYREGARALFAALADGLTVSVGAEYPLAEAARAHADLEARADHRQRPAGDRSTSADLKPAAQARGAAAGVAEAIGHLPGLSATKARRTVLPGGTRKMSRQ